MNPKNILTELKRRNVYRAAVAYGVVAWFLTQLTTQVFPFFEIPNSAVRFVVIALAVGFPIAMLLAWLYEFTPEGIVRTEDLDPVEAKSVQRRSGRLLDFIIIGALLLVIAMLVVGRLPFYRQTGEPMSQKSIAVLPFENLSEDKANAYFVTGMQDEILTALAKISDLKVISRNSTAKYNSHPDSVKTIAQALAVATILEGSVQKSGEAVHINVQLVSGHDDAHVWAESYDRDLKNIFGVEREVAETVAGHLKAKLSPQEATELARVPTTNAQAYDLYLKARYIAEQYWNFQVDSIQPAIDQFRQAIALDPGFALAYAELGHAQQRMYVAGEHRSPELFADIQANAEKSVALEPDLAEGHLLLGRLFSLTHDDAKALTEYQFAEKRSPKNPRIIAIVAAAKGRLGNVEAELAGYERAAELDPHNGQYHRWVALACTKLRRYLEAEQAYTKAHALAPNDWVARTDEALNLIAQGKLADARAAMKALPDTNLKETALSIKYSTLQDIETLSRNYDAALTDGLKIPAMGNRIATPDFPIGDIKKNTDIGFDLLYRGDVAGARAAFTAAREGLEPQRAAQIDNPDFYNAAAFIAAGLGEREKAIDAADKTVTLMPIEKDIEVGGSYLMTLAQVYAHFGDGDEAIPILSKLLNMSITGDVVTPTELRLDPIWDPLRNDPRFQKLVASPSPNTPNK